VEQALKERKWLIGLQRIQTTEEISQFVDLWALLRQLHLSEAEDEITWWFTSNGQYSSKSVYNM
jgi:hypothetical protein